jgi:hypothetical protein
MCEQLHPGTMRFSSVIIRASHLQPSLSTPQYNPAYSGTDYGKHRTSRCRTLPLDAMSSSPERKEEWRCLSRRCFQESMVSRHWRVRIISIADLHVRRRDMLPSRILRRMQHDRRGHGPDILLRFRDLLGRAVAVEDLLDLRREADGLSMRRDIDPWVRPARCHLVDGSLETGRSI